jgi:hypothetical protein
LGYVPAWTLFKAQIYLNKNKNNKPAGKLVQIPANTMKNRKRQEGEGREELQRGRTILSFPKERPLSTPTPPRN